MTFVRLIAKSLVELMLSHPGKPSVGGAHPDPQLPPALATRPPHWKVGSLAIRLPSQNAGCNSFSALTA